MTNNSTIPERLLVLGADFSRHNDALQNISLLRRPHPSETLAGHISSAQALARRARELSEEVLTVRSLNKSLGVRAAMEQTVRLADLADRAADHLVDAVNILHAPNASAPYAAPVHGEADLLAAGRRMAFASRLTYLGAGDCLRAATVLARTLRFQPTSSDHRLRRSRMPSAPCWRLSPVAGSPSTGRSTRCAPSMATLASRSPPSDPWRPRAPPQRARHARPGQRTCSPHRRRSPRTRR